MRVWRASSGPVRGWQSPPAPVAYPISCTASVAANNGEVLASIALDSRRPSMANGAKSRITLCETYCREDRIGQGDQQPREHEYDLVIPRQGAHLSKLLLCRGLATPCRTRSRASRTPTRCPPRTACMGIATSSKMGAGGNGLEAHLSNGIQRPRHAGDRMHRCFAPANELFVAPICVNAFVRTASCRRARTSTRRLTAPTGLVCEVFHQTTHCLPAQGSDAHR